jgi:RND family efflux transporter MFP subunit
MSETELNQSNSSPSQSKVIRRWPLSLLIVVFAVILAFVGSRWIMSMKPVPQKKESREHVVWVDVEKVELGTNSIPVYGMGEVKPFRKLSLMAEVSGKIIAVGAEIEAGVKVKKGQVLCQIDPVSYKADLEARRAEVAQRELALLEEQGRVAQAKRENDRVGLEGGDKLQKELRSRLPHLRVAKSALEAAKAQLLFAEENLKRCTFKAPYSGILTTWRGHLGSQVSPQTQLGELLDHSRYDLELQLRREQLELLPKGGGEAILELPTGNRKGRWSYLMPEHHGKGRLVTLKVSVDNPMSGDAPALFVDSFVTAYLMSHPYDKSVILPRDTLDDEGFVWLCHSGNMLRRGKVDYISIDDESVLVTSGLKKGDLWVKSRLAVAVEGMVVKPLKSKND